MGNVAGSVLPFTPTEEVHPGYKARNLCGWTMHAGTSNKDKSPVSVFRLDKKSPSTTRRNIVLAQNALSRLRTVRHPNVLKFLDGADTEDAVYIVTERVEPLVEWSASVADRDTATLASSHCWGLYCIAKAVSFINNDCKLIHGNICRDSIFVSKSGDWYLAGFELLCAVALATSPSDWPSPMFREHDPAVDAKYKSPERLKGSWDVLSSAPTHAMDSWSFGCLLQEVLGHPMKSSADVKDTSCLPAALRPDYQRMLVTSASARLNLSQFLLSPYFQHPVVTSLLFLDELALKEDAEKQAFFQRLPALLSSFPDEVCKYKVLPILMNALEFGMASGNLVVLSSVLDVGARLPVEEYQADIIPRVVKLFASNDRGTRMQLLERLEFLLPNIDSATLNNQVFQHITTGFMDTEPLLREATVKASLHLAPVVNAANAVALLKFLRKTLLDQEPAIRVNTTVCMGRIAKNFDFAKLKEFVFPSFLRATKDTVPQVRMAAVRAIAHTCDLLPLPLLATQLLPTVCVLTVDPSDDCRLAAIACLEKACVQLRKASETDAAAEPGRDGGEHHAAVNSRGAAASATAAAAGAVAGAFGWAVTSLKSRLYKEGPMEAAEASPSVSSASAPHAAANASTSRSLFASNASPELPVVPISARAGDSGWDMDDTFGGDDWDEPLAAASTAPKKLSPQAPSARTTFTKKASPPASRLEVKHSEPASDGDGWDSFDADLPAVKPKAVMLVSATAPAALSAEERRAQLAAKREERRKTLEQAGKARGVSAEVPEPVAAPAAAEPVVAAPVMKRTGMSLKSKAAVPAMPGEVEKPIAKKLASAPVDGWDDF